MLWQWLQGKGWRQQCFHGSVANRVIWVTLTHCKIIPANPEALQNQIKGLGSIREALRIKMTGFYPQCGSILWAYYDLDVDHLLNVDLCKQWRSRPFAVIWSLILNKYHVIFQYSNSNSDTVRDSSLQWHSCQMIIEK